LDELADARQSEKGIAIEVTNQSGERKLRQSRAKLHARINDINGILKNVRF